MTEREQEQETEKQRTKRKDREPSTLSPALFMSTAAAFIGMGAEAIEPRYTMADIFLRGVNAAPGMPWDAAFVHHVGYWSHYDVNCGVSFWPLPATVSCFSLGQFAEEKRILRTAPSPGDVFLLGTSDGREFRRCGIVTSVTDTQVDDTREVVCRTIEGYARRDGELGGRCVVVVQRVFSPLAGDRFIHWVDLDGRRTTTDPTVLSDIVMGRQVIRSAA